MRKPFAIEVSALCLMLLVCIRPRVMCKFTSSAYQSAGANDPLLATAWTGGTSENHATFGTRSSFHATYKKLSVVQLHRRQAAGCVAF